MSRPAWIVVSLSVVFALSSWLLPHPWVGAQDAEQDLLDHCKDKVCSAFAACTTVRCVSELTYGNLQYIYQRIDSVEEGGTSSGGTPGNTAPIGTVNCQSNDLIDLIANAIGDAIQFDNLNTANLANYGKWFRMNCEPVP